MKYAEKLASQLSNVKDGVVLFSVKGESFRLLTLPVIISHRKAERQCSLSYLGTLQSSIKCSLIF